MTTMTSTMLVELQETKKKVKSLLDTMKKGGCLTIPENCISALVGDVKMFCGGYRDDAYLTDDAKITLAVKATKRADDLFLGLVKNADASIAELLSLIPQITEYYKQQQHWISVTSADNEEYREAFLGALEKVTEELKYKGSKQNPEKEKGDSDGVAHSADGLDVITKFNESTHQIHSKIYKVYVVVSANNSIFNSH